MTTRTPQAKTTDTAKIIRRELAAQQPALVTVEQPATDYQE